MASNTPPFEYGSKAPLQSPSSTFNSLAPAENLDKLLGFKWMVGGNEFKLMKMTAALSAANAANAILIDNGTTTKTHLSAGVVGAAATRDTFGGVCSGSQVALNIGDYVLVQTAGRAICFASGASTTAHTQCITAASGQVTTAGAISSAVDAQTVGIAHAAATSAVVEVELYPIT